MRTWIEQMYPIGLAIEVPGEGTGVVERLTVNHDGQHDGLIVRHADGSFTEVEASFLDEEKPAIGF